MPAGGGVPLEDIGVGDARTLRAEAAAAEAEGRFGYGADVGTGAPRKGALEFVDVRKYAAGSDGDGDGEDGDAAGADRSDDHNDWDLSSLGTTSPDNTARDPEAEVWGDIAARTRTAPTATAARSPLSRPPRARSW